MHTWASFTHHFCVLPTSTMPPYHITYHKNRRKEKIRTSSNKKEKANGETVTEMEKKHYQGEIKGKTKRVEIHVPELVQYVCFGTDCDSPVPKNFGRMLFPTLAKREQCNWFNWENKTKKWKKHRKQSHQYSHVHQSCPTQLKTFAVTSK